MMMRLMVVVTTVAIFLGYSHGARADAPPKPVDQDAALAAQLASGDAAKIEQALAVIRGEFAEDPRLAGDKFEARWSKALFQAHRYDDAAALALSGTVACIADPARVESLQKFRVQALIAGGHGEAAVAAAKQLYNFCRNANTVATINIVCQALTLANQDDPGIGKKFRLEQLTGTNTNVPLDAVARTPSMLAGVRVDAVPYQPAIEKLLHTEDITSGSLKMLGNLYLLADQSQKALEIFQQCYGAAEYGDLANAIENVARAMRAQDGSVGRGNAWILAERTKAR